MTEQTPPVLAERPPYFVAGLVALGALLLYVTTLAPTTQFWDSSEYMAAAHALGIPHPPGNPLFIILGHAWGLLPLGPDYARRINLFAAVTSAAAAGLWFLIGERWLRPIVPPPAPPWARRLAAAVGTSVYLFLPIRAHFDPYLNEGAPTTWRALKAVLTREQFGKPSVFDNPMYLPGPDNPGRTLVLYAQQLLNYVQYFTWQFGRDWWPGVQRAFAVVFAALGLLGARRHWRAERRAALAMTTLLLTLTLALVCYLNLRWRLSQPYQVAALEHELP